MTSTLAPSGNTVAVQVTGCSRSTAAGRSGVVSMHLNNSSANWSTGGSLLGENSFNLASLAPSVLNAYICGDVNTEARGMWLVVAASSTTTAASLLAMLPEANTLSISMMGRGDKLLASMPDADSPVFSGVAAGKDLSFHGSTSAQSFHLAGQLNGRTFNATTMSSSTWRKPSWDGQTPSAAAVRTLTESADLHGAALSNCLVLGSGFFHSRQAASTAFTTWTGPEIDVPSATDLLASGTYGWTQLSFYLVYRATAPVDVTEACLMISPRWVSKPRVVRDVGVAFTHVAGGVQVVANVQPLTISMAAGTPALTVATPSATPLLVNVMNTVSTTVTNPNLTVSFSPATVLPVCGAPWPHARVAVTGVRVSGLGVEIDRPLTVTNRPNCQEVVLAREFEVGLNGVAPLVITSDIPTEQSPSGPVIGDSIAPPVRVTADNGGVFKVESADPGGLLVTQASGDAFKIEPAEPGGLRIAQAAGDVFDVRAGPEQLQPFWVSDIDPDV